VSKLEVIQHLYGYNEWANNRLMETAANVPDERLSETGNASFGNLLTGLAHIAGAQVVWLSRWRHGRNPTSILGTQDKRRLAEVRETFDRSHADLRDFIEALKDEDIEQVLAFRDSSGGEHSNVLWQLMVHVANHGTYHRGEVASALSTLGHSPGDLDFRHRELVRAGSG
jgi:uncharacterized damage-inducible protein DinB